MDPRNLSIEDFDYVLPQEKIAAYPLKERDESKLLIYKNETLSESVYKNLQDFLPENSFLIFNNTKVVEARLLFQKPTGGVIEIFCLEPDVQYKDITAAMLQKNTILYKCLVGGASKWKQQQILEKKVNDFTLQAKIAAKTNEGFMIELSWDKDICFAEVLHEAGLIPLPPYIHRSAELSDAERYQTVYAKHEGSVAAPTAGLHFTDALLQQLQQKNISLNYVTLHVGAGTFMPVKAEKMQDHTMHSEFIDVSIEFIQALINNLHHPVIPVGTTSLRTLESLYWLGVKVMQHKEIMPDEMQIPQWMPYDTDASKYSAHESLTALVNWMNQLNMQRIITKTQIIIAPGYAFKLADALITNFHQPKSTLLLLVSALIGDDWKKVYDYALEHNFRFLSYGDGSLLWSKQKR